ncbi:MAG: hypothetical protein JWQ48_3833 [Conexibacter sp.]|nr:hypothetical protein [Conexibacter sp.]
MWRRIVAFLLVAAILYGLAPAILDVFGAFGDLGRVKPWWWAVVVLSQAAASVCTWAAQRVALHTHGWVPVATSQLASGALGRVVPGGAAAAGALQYRMLVQAGMEAASVATGLTAGSVLLVAALTGLPVLAVPAVIGGLQVPARLIEAALLGVLLFLGLVALGAVLLSSERVVLGIGEATTSVMRRLRPRHPPPADLPARLLAERELVREALGDRWPLAVAAAAGRWLFDFLTLLAALEAVGANPRISLTLLAYCAAQLLALIPLTPGGLGIVEAGLTGTLALTGVPGAAAAVATLAYRLASYWLPLPIGLAAYVWHRRRHPDAAALLEPSPRPG